MTDRHRRLPTSQDHVLGAVGGSVHADRDAPRVIGDPAAAAGLLAVGDRQARASAALGLQRKAGNRAVIHLLQAAAGRRAPVQRQPRKRALSRGDIDTLLWELDDVLFQTSSRLITDTSDPYQAAFANLFAALAGHDLQRRRLGGEERRERFDAAVLALAEPLAHASDDQRGALSRWRTKLFAEEAGDRVAHAVVIEGKVIEVSDAAHPEEQAEALRAVVPELIKTLMLANEQLHRLGEGNNEAYEHAIQAIEKDPRYEHLEGLLEQIEKDFHRPSTVVHTIGALQALLGTIDGWLTLNDKGFGEHLKEVHGTLKGVETFVELIKVTVELGIGSAAMTAVLAWGIAMAAGDTALAGSALSVAGALGGSLANAVAAIEIVHGILVLFDPHASAEAKEEAAVGVASGSAWFIGRGIGGAAVGGPASLSVVGGYLLMKVAAALYWQGALGINAMLMSQTFEYMRQYGESFARVGDEAARAALLLKKERDPRKAQALADALASYESMLAVGLEDFLDHARPAGAKDMGWPGGSAIPSPGNVTILAEAFEPLQRYRGVKSGSALAEGAAHVLERITWCLLHANEIEVASTKRNRHLDDVVDKREAAREGSRASREEVLREVGKEHSMRVEFSASGYRPDDATVLTTRIPGVDLLWFLSGTSPAVTLGDAADTAAITFEGSGGGGRPVRFSRDAAGRLSYEEIPSDSGDYFRAVAKGQGQGASTMAQESFAGMVDIYARLMQTPLAEANLRRA